MEVPVFWKTALPEVDAAYFDAVNELFGAAGQTVVVKEELINAVIATSGSSPAYFFRMAAAMVAQAAELGLDEDTALQLTAATMEGAAGMLLKSGRTAAELTRQVCSPGGTTLAALTAFESAYRWLWRQARKANPRKGPAQAGL